MAKGVNLSSQMNILKAFGIINAPNGNWKYKSIVKGDTFPGFGPNIIPICIGMISEAHYQQAPANTKTSHYVTMNSKTVGTGYVTPGGRIDLWGLGFMCNFIYIPPIYDYDYLKIKGLNYGTVNIWLEKIGGGLNLLKNLYINLFCARRGTIYE